MLQRRSLLNTLWYSIITTIVLLLVVLLSGCNRSNNTPAPEKQSTGQKQQSEEIPDQLKSIEENIEKIFKELDGPSVGVKEQKKEEENQEAGQKSDGSQEKQQSNNQGGEEQSQQSKESGQSEKTQQEPPKKEEQEQTRKDPWKEVTSIANDLHFKWNNYMPSVVKKGAGNKLIDDFSSSLNNLTNIILKKNKNDTLMAANKLYASIPEFYSLYKTKTSPEIKRIRYFARNSMLNSMTSDWTKADSDLESLKSSWSLLKNTTSSEQQELVSKLDLSIIELEKAIKERSQPIIEIKGRIALLNMEDLENKMDDEKLGESSSGGKL